MEKLWCEIICQWFGAKVPDHLMGIFNKPDTSEFADVIECQAVFIVEIQDQPVMFACGIGFFFNDQLPAHAQMDDQCVPGKLDEQVFSSPADSSDKLPLDADLEFVRCGAARVLPKAVQHP